MAIGRPTCHVFLKLFYRLRVEGFESIPHDGPAILVANHQSYWDPIIVGILAKRRPFRAIARSGLFHFRPLGWLIGLFGGLAIDQHRSDTAAMKLAIQEVNGGKALVIYPEGSRTSDGMTGSFQRGFLLVLKRTEAPVVPIAIEGAYDVWPTGRRFPRLRGRLAVRALPPITHEELMQHDQKKVLEDLRRMIETERMSLRQWLLKSSRGKYPARSPGEKPYWETTAGSSSVEG